MSEARQLFMEVNLAAQKQSLDAVEALNTFRGPQGPQGDPGSIDNLTINGKKAAPVDGENRIDLTPSDVGALPSGGTAEDSEKLGGQLPEYYAKQETVSQLSEQMAALQSGVEIVPTVSGSVVSLNDASNLPLRGLILHGKTTQDGTPSPDSPKPLVTAGADGDVVTYATGKNLLPLPKSKTLNGVTLATSGDDIILNGTCTSNNTTFAFDVPGWIPAGKLTASCKVVGGTATFAGSNGLQQNFWCPINKDHSTVFNGTGYSAESMAIRIDAGTVFENYRIRLQIEAGEAATEFEPYKEKTFALSTPDGLPGIPVTSGGNYTDASGPQWICDEIDFERGVRIKRTERFGVNEFAAVEVSGDPNWHDSTKTFSYEIALPNVTKLKGNTLGLCNLAPSYPFGNFYKKGIVDGVMNGQEYLVINLAISRGIDTVDKFKAWCAEKGFAVLKALRYPEETQLLESELAAYRALVTNGPNTTVYNDSGCDQTVRYVADTQLYIDNKTSAAMAAQTAALEDAYAEGVAMA